MAPRWWADPRPAPAEVATALDGLWWDSTRRVPDPRLVQRRDMDIASPIRPWSAPDSVLSQDLRARLTAACGGDQDPIALENPPGRKSYLFGDLVRLEIEVDEAIAKQEPFAERGRSLTQADFPAIVEVVRAQARAEFGPRADQRD